MKTFFVSAAVLGLGVFGLFSSFSSVNGSAKAIPDITVAGERQISAPASPPQLPAPAPKTGGATAPLSLGPVNGAPQPINAETYDPQLEGDIIAKQVLEGMREELKTFSLADATAVEEKMKDRLNALKGQVDATDRSVATLREEVKTLTGSVAEIQKQIAAEKAANEKRFAALEVKNAAGVTSVADSKGTSSVKANAGAEDRLIFRTHAYGDFEVTFASGDMKRVDGQFFPNGSEGTVYILKADGTMIPRRTSVPAVSTPNYPPMNQYQGAPMQQHYAQQYYPEQNFPYNPQPQRRYGTCGSGGCR